MANAIADLARPAPAVVGSIRSSGVAGPRPTSPSREETTPAFDRTSFVAAAPLRPPSTTPRRLGCSGVAGRCLAVRVAAGVYRYAVVAGDAWARSEPVL